MKIENLQLKNNLFLAPLQNITTGPYRRFCRHYSTIGMVYVPMIYMLRVVNSFESVKEELVKIEEEKPISIQLIGNNKETLIQSIDILESYQYDMLDINAGCPSRRAISSQRGGYLMGHLDELQTIINTAAKYSSKPVSLKIRTGLYNTTDINKLSTIINDSGISLLIVHARTVKERFEEGTLDLEFVRTIKDKVDIPVIGDGDIWDGKSAESFSKCTGVDGLMIGRATKGDPEVIKRIETYLKTGKKVTPNKNMESFKHYVHVYEKIIDNYLKDTHIIENKPDFKYSELFRNVIWLTKDLPHSSALRRRLSKCKTLSQIKQALENLNI